MWIFEIKHGHLGYWADFAVYGFGVAVWGGGMVLLAPRDEPTLLLFFGALGLAGWTLVEYLMHRFVLHGIEPFRRWHAMHHEAPAALISTPTVLTAGAIGLLVFLPAMLLGNPWRACALTLGLSLGYLLYSLLHHGIHHWRAKRRWLKERKYLHAVHHHEDGRCSYGVTTSFWDRVFRTDCESFRARTQNDEA